MDQVKYMAYIYVHCPHLDFIYFSFINNILIKLKNIIIIIISFSIIDFFFK